MPGERQGLYGRDTSPRILYEKRSCLSTVATWVTIVAGILSIFSFFFSDADSFLQASSEFLDKFLPSISVVLTNLENTIEQFVQSYPAAPWISALLILLATGLIGFWIEMELVFDNPIYTLLILSPIAFVWAWIFSGVVSTFGILLFALGFIISALIVPILDFLDF